MVRRYWSLLLPATTTWRENGSLAAMSLLCLTSTLNTFATSEVVLGFSFLLFRDKNLVLNIIRSWPLVKWSSKWSLLLSSSGEVPWQFLHLSAPLLPAPLGKWLAVFWNMYLSTWKDMKMKSIKLKTTKQWKTLSDMSRCLQSSFSFHVWAWNGVVRDRSTHHKVEEEKAKYRKRDWKTRWELQWENKKLQNREVFRLDFRDSFCAQYVTVWCACSLKTQKPVLLF